jgi:hypothetical protein
MSGLESQLCSITFTSNVGLKQHQSSVASSSSQSGKNVGCACCFYLPLILIVIPPQEIGRNQTKCKEAALKLYGCFNKDLQKKYCMATGSWWHAVDVPCSHIISRGW